MTPPGSVPLAADSRDVVRRWERPNTLEQTALIGFGLLVILFGAVVEFRSAFLTHRRTDLDVYLRAAWAVRTGNDLYIITDEHGWHFHYPPIFAIALEPLADPPPGYSRAGTIPWGASVAIWYVLSVIALLAGVHLLASAVERAVAERYGGVPPPGSRAWWAVRIVPIMVAIGPVGFTLSRGQANFIELLALCAMIAAIVDNRSYAAGWWLSAAICAKVIPLYLLVYPVWRRDFRMLASSAGGLLLGLVLLPSIVLGPARTMNYFREWTRALVEPAIGEGNDRSRAAELLDINGTDNQSFQAVIHNWMNFSQTWNTSRKQRSNIVEWYVGPLHIVLGIALTAATLLIAGWGRRGAVDEELTVSALCILMILASPISHVHYFVMAIPALLGLFVVYRHGAVYPSGAGLAVMLIFALATSIPLLPHFETFGDLGLASAAALLCWAMALANVDRLSPQVLDTTSA
jgi:alpha-1,2-mannosyltransferase